jgi:transglutaminase-like putative cysteine protease
MATNHDDGETRGARFTLLIGLLVAAGAAAAAFGRVYVGQSVTLRLMLLAAVSFAIAAVLERRHVLIATVVSAAGLLVAIGLLVFPDTLHWRLPTLATLRAIGTALGDVGREAQVTVAPAPPVAPLLLAGITAVWTAAFASHSLAVRARSPFLALAPQAALLAFAGIVVEDGARPAYVLVFMVGCLGVLFADALRRVGQWGTVSVWHGRRIAGLASRTTTRGAWRVAAGCLSVALFLPWLLPGFGHQSILRLNGGANSPVSLNPIVDIRPRLVQNPPRILFSVTSSAPSYWQILTLDTFNGREWSPSDPQASHGLPVQGGVFLPPGQSTSAATSEDVNVVRQHFVLQRLAEPWLPVASDPAIIALNGSARYDPASEAVVLPGLTSQGMTYDVTSRLIVPKPVSLDGVTSMGGPNVDTKLPGDLSPVIGQLAQQWSASATTPYRKVLAIQNVLRSWTYDLRVAAPKTANDLVYFLTKGRRGYCQQFAGAMAVLLRSLGYTARVAVGFLPGTYDTGTRAWDVSTNDYHAWVQVLFPGYGWLSFDPTPTKFRSNPTIALYDDPVIVTPGKACDGPRCFDESNPGGPLPPPLVGGRHDEPAPRTYTQRDFGGLVPQGGAPHKRHARDLRGVGLLAVGGLVLLLLLGIPLVRGGRRRLRRRRGTGPKARVLAAYESVLDVASDVGKGRHPAETIREYRRRMTRTVRFTNGDFETLSALADRAAYAENGLSTDDGRRAASLSRAAAKDIRKSTGWWRKLAGHYALPFGGERSIVR